MKRLALCIAVAALSAACGKSDAPKTDSTTAMAAPAMAPATTTAADSVRRADSIRMADSMRMKDTTKH